MKYGPNPIGFLIPKGSNWITVGDSCLPIGFFLGRYPYNGTISCQLQTLQAMVYQLFDTNLWLFLKLQILTDGKKTHLGASIIIRHCNFLKRTFTELVWLNIKQMQSLW